MYQFKRIEKEDEKDIRGFSATEVLKYLGIPLWKVPMISKHMQAMMSNDIDKIKLFDGVNQLLRALCENGVELGVVSSNNNKNISKVLGVENMALIKYFNCGVSLFGKESKLKKIISISRIKKSEAIFIGDEVRDINAAKKINMASGAVVWGYNNKDALEINSPDIIFNKMEDVLVDLQ